MGPTESVKTLAAATLWISAACGTSLPAQIELDLRLAADPTEAGPPAWTWLRRQIPSHVANMSAADAFGPLELRFDSSGPIRIRSANSTSTASGPYATAIARFENAGTVTIKLALDGTESWQLTVSNGSAPLARLLSLARTLGLGTPGLHRFDIAATVAQFAPDLASHDESIRSMLLTRGAVECGQVEFTVQGADTESTQPSTRVDGRGSGGLLLPLALLLLADAESTGQGLDQSVYWTTARPFDETEHWRILAYAARTDARFEAAAQLARAGTASEVDILERLLWSDSDDATRTLAVEGLIRAGSAQSLPLVVDAIPDTAAQPIVQAAFTNLWDHASKRTKHRVRQQVAGQGGAQLGPHPKRNTAAKPVPLALLLLIASGSILLAACLVTWRRS